MAVFQRISPVAPVVHQTVRPAFAPRYAPPPRTVVVRENIVRNVPVYQPPRVIEHDIYRTNTVFVNRGGWSPEQRRVFEDGARRREFERLRREEHLSDEVAAARAAAWASQQALQQQQLQAQQAILNPPQQPATSPGSPTADLSPQQDAAAPAPADGGAGADADGDGHAHKMKHLLLFVGIAGVAGLVGYKMLKKKKSSKSHSSAE